MQISDFDYTLPSELIAQDPLSDRAASRMLIVDRKTQHFDDSRFAALPSVLEETDTLVLNNTKVFPARLFGTSDSGASIELFLVREAESTVWEVLARPAKRLRQGKRIQFGSRLSAEVIEKLNDGKVIVRFEFVGDFYEILEEVGSTPLPPYIKRNDGVRPTADRDRYQTVFARKTGAIAAPTAGLHFTPEILAAVRARGVDVVEITLHVGYGTFEPVRVNDLSQHTVSPEVYEITAAAAAVLNSARDRRRRLVTIGTTTTRALESNIGSYGRYTPGTHVADLTITPGHPFQAAGAMLTNFHLPASSLLVLTSTFGGHELIMKAYRHAVDEKYRFYSYGDCMLIV